MNVVKCINGHFFDGDSYQVCPHCVAPAGMINPSVQPESKEKKRGLFGGHKSKGEYVAPQQPVSYQPVNGGNFGRGNDPTVDLPQEPVTPSIPPEKKKRNALKTGVTIYAFPDRPWENAQLVKDCGLIPYLLHKNHDMDVQMVGTSATIDDYPYAKYVEGLNLISLGSYDHDTKLEYLAQNAKNIDLLILYGGFEISALFVYSFILGS